MRPCHEKVKLDDCAPLVDAFLSQWTSRSSILAEEEVGEYLTRFELHNSCLGVPDHTRVGTSQDLSYTTPVWRFLITQVCTS
jgi:hypothetical protein